MPIRNESFFEDREEIICLSTSIPMLTASNPVDATGKGHRRLAAQNNQYPTAAQETAGTH